MEHSIIDFGKIENCFKKYDYIESKLLYGDLDAIPNPWMTVLIPTYKRSKLLKTALQSVLQQQHTNFYWDIIVLDNEPYDGKINDTEKVVREIGNERVLYYRNSENIPAGDNFNRGILLARGKWISILHDDDIMISNTIKKMAYMIKSLTKSKKPAAAITSSYVRFYDNPDAEKIPFDIQGTNAYYTSLPLKLQVFHNTQNSARILFFFGNLPSNGSVFNRKAVIETGGFNESMGICADIILLYNLMEKYDVYSTLIPMGLYRKGYNVSLTQKAIEETILGYHKLCKYIFSKGLFVKLLGALFEKSLCRQSIYNYLAGINAGHYALLRPSISCFTSSDLPKPNMFLDFLYRKMIIPAYRFYKKKESKKLEKRMCDTFE